MLNVYKKILFFVMFFTAISAWAQTPQDSSMFSNPDKTIIVKKGSPTFTIRLAANRTTGYSWFIKKLNTQVLKIDSHKYVAPQQQMPGAGGYEEWNFTVKSTALQAPTTTDIKLIYARPWEKTSAKEVIFKVVTE